MEVARYRGKEQTSASAGESRESVSERERAFERELAMKSRDEAAWSLFQLIVDCARQKDFRKAEALRERLVQLDPMALTEIITSAEIIEEEKTKSRSQDHSKLWASLYAKLTSSEANALYYSMKERSTLGIEPLFMQGDSNTDLHFLNEGRLIMLWSQGGREVAVRTFRPGDIIGEETFFSSSVCTASVRTFSHSRFNVLEKDVLNQWRDQFPALEAKLREYCGELRQGSDSFKSSSPDRRSEKRRTVSGQAMLQLLYDSGEPIRPAFKGELLNVSSWGICVAVRILKRQTAQLLLGRKMGFKFMVSSDKDSFKLDQRGRIVAIQPLMLDDYTVHVEFDEKLGDQMVATLENLPEIEEKPCIEQESLSGTLHIESQIRGTA